MPPIAVAPRVGMDAAALAVAATAASAASAAPAATAATAATASAAEQATNGGHAQDDAVVVDPNVERGLAASVRVFDFCKQRLLAMDGEAVDEAPVTRAELVRLRRAGLAMNQAITRLTQARNAREDRYIVELHLLRQILQREATDRDANRARVYEMLRKNLTATDDAASVATPPVAAASGGANANPLNAPSASSLAVDKALATVGRIDASLLALSASGTSTVHGAGLISAHNARQQALVELA